MQLFKVYISSTFIDLKEHRKAVRDFFGKFRDKFEIISMEDYVAVSQSPVEKCVEDVIKCDFYILILANRYGFIPKSSEKFQNPGELSVTNAEYITAKENNKKIFAFFADNSADFQTDDDSDEELKKKKAAKLKAFKDEVKNNFLAPQEKFNSPYQLALMISESMMKAREDHAGLLPQGGQHLIDRYINQDRIDFLDRIPQFNLYQHLRIENKSPFKPIIIQGEKDSLVESVQKRITNIILNIPRSKIYNTVFNSIFGTGPDYEEAKRIFLDASTNQFFSDPEITSSLKSFKDLAIFLNTQQETRIAFVINWTKLVNKAADPRISYLAKMLKEIYDACLDTNCRNIFFFININYKPEDEEAFTSIVKSLGKAVSDETKFLIELPQLSPVINEDLGLWIDNYITEIPYKKNKIISAYLAELDDEFSMQKAQEKIAELINKVNNKDPEVLQILN